MTGTLDPLMASGGFRSVIQGMPMPWRVFWEQVSLVEELDDKIVFSAPPGITPHLVESAPTLRKLMKHAHCSTPDRYRIEIQTSDGEVSCI